MKIIYKNKKLEKECTSLKTATQRYGSDVGKALLKLTNFIEQAENLKDISNFPQYRLHQLKGDRKNQYTITILKSSKYRLIVYPLDENEKIFLSSENERLMFKKCKIINIVEVSEHYE